MTANFLLMHLLGFIRMKTAVPPALLALLVLLAGCSSTTLTAHKAPQANLGQLKHLFVERRLNDNHRMNELIVQELHGLGYDAGSGPLTMMPPDTDAVITYEEAWTDDFSTHLIGLVLMVDDNRQHQRLAEASYSRPSVTHMSPAEMVHLTVVKLFKDS